VEIEMPDPAEVLKDALSLDVHDRAALAQRLLASLDELSEEEAERLWAEEAQRRREDYHRGPGQGSSSRRGSKEGGETLPVKPIMYHEAAEDELLNQIGYLEILAVPAPTLVP
jgi:hypothetical protein